MLEGKPIYAVIGSCWYSLDTAQWSRNFVECNEINIVSMSEDRQTIFDWTQCIYRFVTLW